MEKAKEKTMDKAVDYPAIGAEIGRLVAKKQEAYGDSFGKSGEVLAILYPNGVKPGQYRNLLATARVIDKLFRIANQEGAFGEDPWKDIAGYAILALANNKDSESYKHIFPPGTIIPKHKRS